MKSYCACTWARHASCHYGQALHLRLLRTLTVCGCWTQHTSFALWGFCDVLHAPLHYLQGFRFSHRRLWGLWSTGVWSRAVTAVIFIINITGATGSYLYHQHNRSDWFLFCIINITGATGSYLYHQYNRSDWFLFCIISITGATGSCLYHQYNRSDWSYFVSSI